MTDPNQDAGQELSILPALVSYRDTAAHSFVPPSVGSVLAAARRRTQRRVSTLAAVAVLAVVGATAATATVFPRGGGPLDVGASPSPSAAEPKPSQSAAPEPTPSASAVPSETPATPTSSIPTEAMLAAADLGPGSIVDEEGSGGDWRLDFLTMICEKDTWTPFPGVERETTDSRERYIGGPTKVFQSIDKYVPGAAAHAMNRTRTFVRDCASFASENAQHTLEVVASGFAGQDSLMVKSVNTTAGEAPRIWLHVYIRQGDLVSQLAFIENTTQARARAVAVTAAQRMCAATPTC